MKKQAIAKTGQEKEIIGNLLLFLMFALEAAYLYSASSATLILCGILGAAVLLYALKTDAILRPIMIVLAAGIVTLVTINRVLVLNCSWSGCLRIVFLSLPIAYLLCTVHINRYAAILFFYAVFLYTVIQIALADPAELYRIFAASSRNYISVLLIACTFPYYLACSYDHAEVSIFPALLSFPVSIYVQSRGGMIASGILAALSFGREIYLGFVKGSFKNRQKRIRFLISAALVFGVVFFTLSPSSADNPSSAAEDASSAEDASASDGTSAAADVSAADVSAADDPSADYLSRFYEPEEYPITRLDMWKEYITVTASSVKNILLGPPLTTCPFILEEAYNSHNSYFMTHSYMGIVGFLVVVSGAQGHLVLSIKKKEFSLLFLSIAFLIRAMTDYLFPMLFCDCIILFMILKAGIGFGKADYEYEE